MTTKAETKTCRPTAVLGERGERAAERYLCERGLRLRARNWRSGRLGEIDLVMEEADQLVFVEVKTRTRSAYSNPVEAVDQRRLYRLRKLAAVWLRSEPQWREYRIDIVALTVGTHDTATIQWLRGVDR